jgi:hypothetical protein
VLHAVPGDQVCGTATAAGARGGLAHRRDDLRVACEAEIIVAAEIDDALAFDYDFGAVPFDGKRFDRAATAPQVLTVYFRKCRLNCCSVSFHGVPPGFNGVQGTPSG